MNKEYEKYFIENVRFDTYKYKSDKKYHIYYTNNSRIINVSSGYTFLLPIKTFEYDYTYSSLRCKYFFDDCVLTTSFEDKNPYTDGN